MVVVGRAGGGACTGGGFGCVVVVVVVVVEVVVLTVMSATSGVGTMLTDWVVLAVCEPGDVDETGLESMLHPATPSTTSSPTAANAGIHRAFRVSTGCTLRLFALDL
ncbi:hypothetical protein GCM10027200_26200 [Lentzea nigeriaca]